MSRRKPSCRMTAELARRQALNRFNARFQPHCECRGECGADHNAYFTGGPEIGRAMLGHDWCKVQMWRWDSPGPYTVRHPRPVVLHLPPNVRDALDAPWPAWAAAGLESDGCKVAEHYVVVCPDCAARLRSRVPVPVPVQDATA